MRPTYHVYVSEHGNVFMTEIATVVADALTELGYDTVFPAVGLPEAGRNRINLVVAPHEFFPLQQNVTERDLLRAAEASVTIGVEQPGTSWFELGTHYASVGPIALDISHYAVHELDRLGVDAMHLQLGYHGSWDRWGGDPDRRRPTDLLFLGSVTDRRNRILSEAASLLWDCTADIRLFEFLRPMSEPRSNFVVSLDKWNLLASSKILLNIHRNDVPYFEWVRVLEAVCNGCLVVTETSSDYGPLVPGEHLIAVPSDVLGAYTASIILDDNLRMEMSTAAYEFVRGKLDLRALLEPVCTRIEDVSLSRLRARTLIPFRSQKSPSAPPTTEVLNDVPRTEQRVWARIKELLDGETDLLQRVEALQARLEYGDADHTIVSDTSAWPDFQPDVSVVITLYNYSEYITEAITSVLSSTDVHLELIIVDDHSTDDSVEIVTDLMLQKDWFPIRLIARTANAGVSNARDLGIRAARADRVFILDADNTIYPDTLKKLSRALDRSPTAACSYGIIAKTGDTGLLSYLPWDVTRLARGNYIDAMAMIRRKVWEENGGYDPDYSLRGWEDYEFWLRLAADGRWAEFVPEILGLYRVHSTSRQQTVNLHTTPLMREFRERFPTLPWEQ